MDPRFGDQGACSEGLEVGGVYRINDFVDQLLGEDCVNGRIGGYSEERHRGVLKGFGVSGWFG